MSSRNRSGSSPSTQAIRRASGSTACTAGGGAAPFGFNADGRFTVAYVDPGFKNPQFCQGGAAQNCFDIDREGGRRYERQLQQAVASGRRIIAVETWNEFS